MNLLRILLIYVETIVNIFSNALVQTFLVYTTVVMIYKIWIEEQTTNYIPLFITTILDRLKMTYNEIDYSRRQYSSANTVDLETKYQLAEINESNIHKANNEHNQQVINNALRMSIGILFVFVLFTLITSHFDVHIHWYQLFLSAAITVVGTLYEYFFITQIAVKYNYINLTQLYDSMVEKVELISDTIVQNNLITDLEKIVKNTDTHTNTSSLSNFITTDVLKNTLSKATPQISNIINTSKLNIENTNVNHILKQFGNSMNDTEHETMKNNVV